MLTAYFWVTVWVSNVKKSLLNPGAVQHVYVMSAVFFRLYMKKKRPSMMQIESPSI